MSVDDIQVHGQYMSNPEYFAEQLVYINIESSTEKEVWDRVLSFCG